MRVANIAATALRQAGEGLDGSAQKLRRSSTPAPAGADQLELSEAAVELLLARQSFEAALKLAETADETARDSLNLLA